MLPFQKFICKCRAHETLQHHCQWERCSQYTSWHGIVGAVMISVQILTFRIQELQDVMLVWMVPGVSKMCGVFKTRNYSHDDTALLSPRSDVSAALLQALKISQSCVSSEGASEKSDVSGSWFIINKSSRFWILLCKQKNLCFIITVNDCSCRILVWSLSINEWFFPVPKFVVLLSVLIIIWHLLWCCNFMLFGMLSLL